MAEPIIPDTSRLQEIALEFHENHEDWHRCPGLTCGNVCALVSLLERIQPQWQPIETAPKDGSSVLLWLPRIWQCVALGAWVDQDEYPGTWLTGNCRTDQSLPTHWMPLPKGPKS